MPLDSVLVQELLLQIIYQNRVTINLRISDQFYNILNTKFHTRSLNKLGVEASPSSKLSIKRGNITSTSSDLLTAALSSANRRITFSCTKGTAGFSWLS